MNRRDALRIMAAAPFLTALDWAPEQVSRAALAVDALGGAAIEPVYFSAHEWQTVRVLVDLIIPADEKSGSATEMQVPEFMDFIMNESSESRKEQVRAGFRWLDAEAQARFRTDFVSATDAQRRAILDDIAWPERAPAALKPGADWFTTMRDMTAAGFFTTQVGYADVGYQGGEFVREWTGCPPEAMARLGVDHSLMEKRA